MTTTDEQLLSDRAVPVPASHLRSLWLQAAALLGMLLLGLLLYNGYPAVPDEGVYLAQADRLSNGTWWMQRPAPDIDTEGVFAPVMTDPPIGDRLVPYSKHPLYPLLLTPTFWLFGSTGALLVSVIGTWGAAVSAAFIARRIKPAYGPWALWIVGIGSPLLFDAYIAVAHSLAAATAGLAFLGTTRAIGDRRWVHLSYALPAVAVTVALRSEGLLFCIALAVVAGASAVSWRHTRKVDVSAALVAVGTLVVTGSALLVSLWSGAQVRGGGELSGPVARLESTSLGIWGGIWSTLLRPFERGWSTADPYLPLAAVCVCIAALALKIRPRFTLLPLSLLGLAAVATLAHAAADPQLVTGLISAFPILAAGLILLRWECLSDRTVSYGLATSALVTVGVLATNYSVGGAAEWGGRFLHLLLPVLVPVALLGLDRGRQELSRPEAIVAGGLLLAISLGLSISALRTQQELRQKSMDLTTSSVEIAEREAQDGEPPLIAVASIAGSGISRYFWDAPPSVEVLNAGDLSGLGPLLLAARDAGRTRVTIVTTAPARLFELLLRPALDELGWEVLDSNETPEGFARVVTVGVAEPRSPEGSFN